MVEGQENQPTCGTLIKALELFKKKFWKKRTNFFGKIRNYIITPKPHGDFIASSNILQPLKTARRILQCVVNIQPFKCFRRLDVRVSLQKLWLMALGRDHRFWQIRENVTMCHYDY